jgi:hypothetical protein
MTAPLQSRTCQRCASEWMSVYDEVLCQDCRSADFFGKLTVEDRIAVETFIYDHQTLAAIKEIRERMPMSLGDAQFLFHWWKERLNDNNDYAAE